VARSPPVRLSRGLLLVSAAFGTLSVGAALTSAYEASLQCALATLIALTGYVTLEGKAAARRVRWGLAAGIGLLAAVAAARLFWYGEQAADRNRLLSGRGTEPTGIMLEQWWQTINQQRIAAVGLLLGMLCLTVAVLAVPERRPPKRGVVPTVVALLLLVLVGRAVLSHVRIAPVIELVAAVWPALLATVVAAGLLAISGRPADRTWLLPIGALLVAVAVATAAEDLAAGWSAWWTLAHPRQGAMVSVAISVSADDGPQWSAAWETAVALAGPALLAIGALRSRRAEGED
jgi:hypothetical protein